MKHWKLLHSSPLNGAATDADILDIICENRGIEQDHRALFLSPSLDVVTSENAGLDRGMIEKAIERISLAISRHEPICVYTDYDVDGVCSGAILWETLHGLGATVMPYIPHREREGYGLSEYGIDQIIKEQKTSLLITADHGISAADKIAYAKKKGVDTIVLDHHLIPDQLPDVIALIHTTRLCAAGISWLFAREIARALGGSGFAVDGAYLDLAALATVADLIPLVGINRSIVANGLRELRHTKRIGLKAMYEEAGISQEAIDVYTIGHVLAPRINAMGRVNHAMDALRLLCTRNTLRAKQLAQRLGSTNRERQQMTEEASSHAMERARQQYDRGAKLLFVDDPSYAQGVIGLVAGRLTQEFYRPSIVVARGEEYSKASARSIAGCNIVEAIRTASDLLVNVGGHPMAAGFTVETKHLEALQLRLIEYLNRELTDDLCLPTLSIDAMLAFSHVNRPLISLIQQLSPFGIGNPQPVFGSMGIRVSGVKLVGRDGKHLKCTLQDENGIRLDAIGFGMGNMADSLVSHSLVDAAYTVELNTWNEQTQVQLKLKDMRIPA